MTSLAACSVLCGGLSLAAVCRGRQQRRGGAIRPSVGAPASLDFGSLTLGDVAGPQTFTLTNSGVSDDVISTANTTASGPGANDYFAIPDPHELSYSRFPGRHHLDAGRHLRPRHLLHSRCAGPAECHGQHLRLPGVRGDAATQRRRHHRLLPGRRQGQSRPTSAMPASSATFPPTPLNKPIVGIAQTGDDSRVLAGRIRRRHLQLRGRWLLRVRRWPEAQQAHCRHRPDRRRRRVLAGGPDGGIFSYGDAQFSAPPGASH